jgi:5-methylcytosine-specific restriction endonuclease McrA
MRKAYRERNKESIKAQMADNYQRNKDKRLSYVAKRYKENPQPTKDAAQRWQKRNPEYMAAYSRLRTARKRNNDLRYISKKELKALYKKSCIYCGIESNIEIDHVIPIARGGRHAIGNLAPACMKCNRSKRDLFVMEWRLRK